MHFEALSHRRRWRPAVVRMRSLSGLDAPLRARLAGVPRCIHSEHGFDVDRVEGGNRKRNLLRRFQAPLVDRYVTVPQHSQNILIEHLGIRADHITQVCIGVETGLFVPKPRTDLSRFPPGLACEGMAQVGAVGRLQAAVDRPAPSTAKRWLRHSALAQYINSQLKFRPEAFWRSVWTRQTPELQAAKPEDLDRATVRQADVERSRQVIDAVLDRFFKDVAPYAKGRLVIAVDGSRGVEPTPPSDGKFERAYLIASLRERGATVVELESIFRKHALASGRSLQVGPYDAHLNAVGVGLAMQAAAFTLLHP